MRIRGINQVTPKFKKTFQLFRLRQISNGVFIKLNEARRVGAAIDVLAGNPTQGNPRLLNPRRTGKLPPLPLDPGILPRNYQGAAIKAAASKAAAIKLLPRGYHYRQNQQDTRILLIWDPGRSKLLLLLLQTWTELDMSAGDLEQSPGKAGEDKKKRDLEEDPEKEKRKLEEENFPFQKSDLGWEGSPSRPPSSKKKVDDILSLLRSQHGT